MNEIKKFQDEHYYNELTDEEINYQLEMSDPYEFSYHYAKYLQQQLQAYKVLDEINTEKLDSEELIIVDRENQISKLQKQLQAHKDKEDKLRELIDDYISDKQELTYYCFPIKTFLQILDGSENSENN